MLDRGPIHEESMNQPHLNEQQTSRNMNGGSLWRLRAVSKNLYENLLRIFIELDLSRNRAFKQPNNILTTTPSLTKRILATLLT